MPYPRKAIHARPVFSVSENAIQSAILAHWRALALPGSLIAAIPNKAALGQPGLTAGLFDLVVISPTLGDKTGWLELKTDHGHLSQAQHDFGHLCAERGIPHAVTFGRDEPIEVLRAWGAVR